MYLYVTRMFSYATRMYSYVTRMYWYVLVCYSYRTFMNSCGVLATTPHFQVMILSFTIHILCFALKAFRYCVPYLLISKLKTVIFYRRRYQIPIEKKDAVAICPAGGQGLEWTKCPAVRNFHRISV